MLQRRQQPVEIGFRLGKNLADQSQRELPANDGELLQQLKDWGTPQITNKIAGASLSSWEPRGLGRIGSQFTIPGAIGTSVATLNPLPLAAIPAQLALSSPRVVGEAARAFGAGQRYLGYLQPRSLIQSARKAERIPPVVPIDTTGWGQNQQQ